MRVNGIIAEYNPFHNGHGYHIDAAKKQNNADYTIIAMSGNFMQRGEPALIDKYKRAEMALLNGADLVLELPAFYSASSAEFFARGGVTLLDKLGVVDSLCFGSECGDVDVLRRIAEILADEPEKYVSSLRRYIKDGLSYPTARTNALLEYDPTLSNFHDVLSSPNNILGMEYIKTLILRKSSIQPVTTKRIGSSYHDLRLGINQSSAKAIRQVLYNNQDLSCVREQMPESAYRIMEEFLRESRPVLSNDLSSVLLYKLLQEKDDGYEKYLDVSPELSDRIINHLYEFKDFESFCTLLKTKDMTHTRISRCLLHILLNIETKTMQAYRRKDYIPYARVLGFRKESSPLLTAIKEMSSIPMVTKLADAEDILNAPAYAMLERELKIDEIYQSVAATFAGVPLKNELSKPIVIV